MVTLATLGMLAYGLYSLIWAVVDIARGARLEIWAELGLILFGLLLIPSAALVRAGVPGGLAAAIGAMFGLQALAVHNATHLGEGIGYQVARAGLAAALATLAWLGSHKSQGTSHTL